MTIFDLNKANEELNNVKKKRVYAYVRVSHTEQVLNGYSLQAQKDALLRYAEENNMIIIDWFIDEGKTARTKLKNRRELQRLLIETEKREAEQIIFIKLDRWVRNVADYYDIEKILDKNGFTWKTTQEDYDNSTRDGRLKINLNLSIAQDESDRTSERIKFVNENKIKKGGVITGNSPYGYKIVKKDSMKVLEKNEEEELIVEEIFEYFSIHQNQRQTWNYVVEKYNFPLGYRSLVQMLRKPIYTGHYKGNDNYCQPYISKEEFEKIQEILKKNIKSGATYGTYIFSGLFRCPCCNRSMAGGSKGKKKKDGKTLHWYYGCNNARDARKCKNSKLVAEIKVEEYLLHNITEELKKYQYQLEVSKKEAEKNIPKIDVASIKREMDRLNKQYRKGRIEDEEYESEYARLEMILKKYDVKNSVLEPNIDTIKKIMDEDFATIYETLTREEKRAMWRSIIKSITVIDYDNIQVDFI